MARVSVAMRRAGRLLLILPAAPILALLASGCGGGGKTEVSATELVQRGDRICREEQAKFDQLQSVPLGNASDAADQTKALIQVAENANSQLGDLEPPEALRGPLGTYLEARDRAVDQMKRGQEAAENQDSATYVALQTAVARTAPQRRKLAAALGFKLCSANPGSA